MSPELLNTILGILAVPVASLLATCLWRLQARLGMEGTAQDKANMEHEIQVAIGAGTAQVCKLTPMVLKDGITSPAVMSAVSVAATDFLKERYPDRVKQIGANAPGMGTDAAVQQSVEARLINVNPATAGLPGPGPAASGAAT